MISFNPNHPELVQVLIQNHQAKSSGTLFVVTGDNRSAKFVFQAGDIIAISLRHLRGMEALQAFPSPENCKCRFSSELKMPVHPQELSNTSEIIHALLNENQETLPRIASRSAEPRIDPNMVEVSYEEALQILSNAAIEYLGPMAVPICREYFPDKGEPPQMSDLSRALNQLGADLQNSQKHHELVEKVMAQIKR